MRIVLEMAEYLESCGLLSLEDIRRMISKGLLASKYWNGIASWVYRWEDYYDDDCDKLALRQAEQEQLFNEEAFYWESVESALRKHDDRRRAKKQSGSSNGARSLRRRSTNHASKAKQSRDHRRPIAH
jgi:hypothetical protein